jgi:hypothetical protein
MEDPVDSTGSATVTEEATDQEEWGVGSASITEGATSEVDWTTGFALVTEFMDPFATVTKGLASQEDWSADEVADPMQETELFLLCQTVVYPDVGGWNTSLAKREC